MPKTIIVLLVIIIAVVDAFGQSQTPPTLRIVTETPNLPSDLYYGDTKVKPLRLRPGTNQPITIDDGDFFVQQQYVDFLNRFPEAQGFSDWMNYLNGCNGDAECTVQRRITTSSGFFRSREFFETGYFVYRLYTTSLGRYPRYAEFMPDARQLDFGVGGDRVEASKLAFANQWVQRSEFTTNFPTTLSTAEYVRQLALRANLQLSQAERDALAAGGLTRAQILIRIADHSTVLAREYNAAFVHMEYFGYLRRDPEPEGLNNWLNYLNAHPTEYSTMVWGFIYSIEYRNRF